MSSSSNALYVVAVDSRNESSTSSWSGYTAQKCDADYFRNKIVEHPKMRCFASPVAALCGLDLKVYCMKAKQGLAQYYREGGASAAMGRMALDQGFLRNNNGIASGLTIDPENGLPEWTITGKAYVVWNDGTGPLSKGQVWGIQEMVNCLMDIYDFDEENMIEGYATLKRWAEQYKEKTWEPPSGCGGVDIYSSRSD